MLSEADKEILKEYFGEDNLRLAFERYKRHRDPDTKDHSGIEIFESNLVENIKNLSKRLLYGVGSDENQFNPIKPLKFYQPKKTKGSQRTMTLIFIEEAIVYQSIVDKIAFHNHEKLSEVHNSVFSYRLSEEVKLGTSILEDEEADYYFYEKWQDFWNLFVYSSSRQLKNKNQYRLETDISGFYDTIQHNILVDFLRDEFKVPKIITETLEYLLNRFSGTPDKELKGIGLPQSSLPSHFLAQLMLYKFDLDIIDQGFSSYFRYVDDIHLYSKNENDLYKAKSYIEKKLKDLSLYMNSKKTEIIFLNSEEKIKKEEDALINRLFIYNNHEDEKKDRLKVESYLHESFEGLENIKVEYERKKSLITYDELISSLINNKKLFVKFMYEINKYSKDKIKSEEYSNLLSNVIVTFSKMMDHLDLLKSVCEKYPDFKDRQVDKTNAHGLNISEFILNYMPDDYHLSNWIDAYENSLSSNKILIIIDSYYKKTEKVKAALLCLFYKYDYLEYVQYRIALILSSKEFKFSSNELSELWSKSRYLTTFTKLSFYMIFFTHLSENDSLFSTVKRRLNNVDKHFYIKDYIFWRLKWKANITDQTSKFKKLFNVK